VNRLVALLVFAFVLAPITGSTTRAEGSTTRGKPVVLAFAGDVHFEGSLEQRLAGDAAQALSPIAPVLRSADIAVVNLETAVTDGGTPTAKEFTFRAPSTAFEALRGAGVDVASMANNHGLDYGVAGLRDSLGAFVTRVIPGDPKL